MDFADEDEVGDLIETDHDELPEKQRYYWSFAHEMKCGDVVLIIAHNYPFALATIEGDYNYIRFTVPEIHIWFKHFRKVEDVYYYADFNKSPKTWPEILTRTTVQPLRHRDTEAYKFMKDWINSI